MSKNEEQIDLTDSDEQILNRVWQNMAIQDEASTVAQVLADPDNDHNRALALAELIVGLEDQDTQDILKE